MYTVCRCQHGVLDKCYGEGDLEIYGGKLDFMVKGWKAVPSLSLREAARYLNGALGSTCNCLQGCKGKKCVCFKKNMLCSSKCHAGTKCSNIQRNSEESIDFKRKIELPKSFNKKENKRKPVMESPMEPPSKKIKIEDTKLKPPKNQIKIGDITNVKEKEVVPMNDQSWIQELLSQKELTELISGKWLSDSHIIAAQKLLQRQFKLISGLQPPYLEQHNQFKKITTNGVQVINENSNHWVCVSTIGSLPNTIDVYNSMTKSKISAHIMKQCGELLRSKRKHVTIRSMACQPQVGGSDCGLYAIECN